MGGHYFYEHKFSAGGSKNAPEEEELDLTSGVIHDIIIDFPAGCMYLTHLRLMRGSMSLFPRNQGAFYAYENYKLVIRDFWILEERESKILLEGYNFDTTYDHTIRIALQVTDPELYFAERGVLEKLEEFITLQKQFYGLGE